MKSIASFLFLFMNFAVIAQNNEFGQNDNELMYTSETMSQLKYIVDSLNIKYRSCEYDKVFYSKYQTKAHYVSLEKGSIKSALKDMAKNITYQEFLKKYPSAYTDTSLVVLKRKYHTYDKQVVVEFESFLKSNEVIIQKDSSIFDKPLKGTWVIDDRKDSGFRKGSIQAFYFPDPFRKQPLPDKYGRMIEYVDCMVDTTAQVFEETARRSRDRIVGSEKLVALMDTIQKRTHMPVFDYDYGDDETFDEEKFNAVYAIYAKKDSIWRATRFDIIENALKTDLAFKNLIDSAVEEALETHISNNAFEEYVEYFYSADKALYLKRNRIVIGGCSQDMSPRVHAMNIAKLSAKTVNWEIFLRSHLDIMNDNFQRVSDGSYAQAGRQTYIKELEELDIDVLTLLFGISLRLDNPSNNHYYGSVSRVGRALSESENPEETEKIMLDMIADNELDDFNRICIYYLFRNYNHYIKDELRKEKNAQLLEETIANIPSQLFAVLKTKE